MTRSVQLPYQAYVTAFLQTGLFLDYLFPRCNLLVFATMYIVAVIVNFTEMLAPRNNGELESFSSVLVIGQRNFCGSLNWREIQSKNKSVCENAVRRI